MFSDILIRSNLKVTPFNLFTFGLKPSPQNPCFRHVHKTWLSRRLFQIAKLSFNFNLNLVETEMALLLTSPTTHPTEKVAKSVISQLLLKQFDQTLKVGF